MAFATIALLEGAAMIVYACLLFRIYVKSERFKHIAVMAFTLMGIVGAVILRMWEGAMDDDPWLVAWFLVMFGLGIYGLWWFWEQHNKKHEQ